MKESLPEYIVKVCAPWLFLLVFILAALVCSLLIIAAIIEFKDILKKK